MNDDGLEFNLTDGIVSLRPLTAEDKSVLLAGRDDEFHRFIGDSSPDPDPVAVICNAEEQVVGWIDYDEDRDWLTAGEVNVGYSTFPEHRGRGFAWRALRLLMSVLTEQTTTAATLLIDPANLASIAVAKRAGFEPAGDIRGQLLYKRSIA